MSSSFSSIRNLSFEISLENAYSLVFAITNVLAEYSWIYETKNTEIFVHNVLDRIPFEWIETINLLSLEEFKKLPYGYIKDNWPSSLKKFLTKSIQLAEFRFPKNICYPEEKNYCSSSVKKNIPLKKQNEISLMSNLVNHVCKLSKSNKVLDIGSGLGYLDEVLHHSYGLHCVGIDCVKRLTDGAVKRLKMDPCISCMHHETVKIENREDCINQLQNILKNTYKFKAACCCERLDVFHDLYCVDGSVPYVMVGLHCCGNLMQDMMKIFCRMDELQAFVCVGCCYNKINLDDFPMSKTMKKAVHSIHKEYSQWHPCISGLRLASHATRADLNHYTTEKLQFVEKSLIFRSILEYYIKYENIQWKKPKRHVRPEDLVDFENYCNIMLQNSHKTKSDIDHQNRMKKLQDIYSDKEKFFPRVKVLLVLQTLLQPLYESIVILDRILYFKEKNIKTEVLNLWDDAVSPRNMVICAFKN